MEWESYYKEAADYYQAALGASKKKTLGNLVIYNVVAMSIEILGSKEKEFAGR